MEDHHAEWLSLVETSGPFLTVPALKRALPDGLDAAPGCLPDLRVAYAEWRQEPGLQPRFIRWVLQELLELRGAVCEATDADPLHHVSEQAVTLRPSYVVRDRTRDGAPAVLLVHRVAARTALDRPIPGQSWAASPIDRAAALARASGVPLALVTDGGRWTLVWAREGESTGTCTWRSELWLEEPITLRAFVTLLGAKRFFNLSEAEGLGALLRESAGRQQEVADQLGAQVRRAVELLIATLDREDRDRHGELLQHLESAEVYRGAVTVMMRLVFLFVAEERRLLPIDVPRYAETLAASTLRAQLQERADRDGEDPLERSTAAWHRILALFRAVHSGIEHDALRLPAYGGGLFHPDRYPFLEGRPPKSSWREVAADPLPVDDRTMLHLLDALGTLAQGGARVLLSYRALDVEQIGHVYEGLLDHTAVRLTDTALGLGGRHEPELTLARLDGWAAGGRDTLVERLARQTGRSATAIRKALDIELSEEQRSRLRAACAGDDALLGRVAPYHALLRADLRGDPLVFLPGSLFVTQTLDRRSSGTYYTPRQLAEEVVRHALDPVVYHPGPAQERDPAQWKLRSARELLDLRIADIAMGSGAFLVAACRYLAARLQEAWSAEDTPIGLDIAAPPAALRDSLPADPIERQALAHRLVAERCLYGVDKNPMAVEMAKLSLWLITLAKDRPFSFVDHALRAGDSLLGITQLQQLRVAHLDPGWHRQASFELGFGEIEAAVDRALELRRELEAFVVRDIPDAERKATMLDQADAALGDARLLGDLVVGAALAQLDDCDPLGWAEVAGSVRTMVDPDAAETDRLVARTRLRALADDWLVERRRAVGEVREVVWADRDPFHWALEFPEVRAQGGFDAIVGNPPFQGGKKISGAIGSQYRDYLFHWLAGGVRGSADLVAYFYLRAARLLRPSGGFGLIATNTIAQGDTREVGLDQLAAGGWSVHRAIASEPWPGGANLEMATVWGRRDGWAGDRTLDRVAVTGITSALTISGRVGGAVHRLAANAGQSFIGSLVNGMGFVLTPEEADAMLTADSRNADVVRPYLNGEDLNSRPDCSPARWVIDFRGWPIERARDYPEPFAIVERLVKPVRANVRRAVYREKWWQFAERGLNLYRAIVPLERVIVIALVSKTVMPVLLPNVSVYSHALGVFAYDDDAHFGLLSSGFHRWWAIARASTLETRVRYTPTDCFETFPQPDHITSAVGEAGGALNSHRTALMLDRGEGLTKIYNRAHDYPAERSADIGRLRELHVALDRAVAAAYGWSDLDPLEPPARREILDRLLELGHERYAQEVRQGLHGRAKPRGGRRRTPAGAISLELEGV
ncbi:MAG: restriction endonuclease [Solirubrobacterales bacterium]|nr:MAG: restriction endonuclease [Solirubrobacterales bacterium]